MSAADLYLRDLDKLAADLSMQQATPALLAAALVIAMNTPTFAQTPNAPLRITRMGEQATVPGAAFGLEPYLRLSFATSREKLTQALTNLAAALADLH